MFGKASLTSIASLPWITRHWSHYIFPFLFNLENVKLMIISQVLLKKTSGTLRKSQNFSDKGLILMNSKLVVLAESLLKTANSMWSSKSGRMLKCWCWKVLWWRNKAWLSPRCPRLSIPDKSQQSFGKMEIKAEKMYPVVWSHSKNSFENILKGKIRSISSYFTHSPETSKSYSSKFPFFHSNSSSVKFKFFKNWSAEAPSH